jgi:hypothetical protein
MTLDHMSRGIDPDPSSPVPSERKRTTRAGTVIAALVVALIVLAAVVVILATRGGGDSASPATPTPRPSSTSTAPAPTTTPTSTSTLPPADRAVPDSPPAGVTWALFQGVALPTSSTSGPLRVAGPVYAGYAHTPTGALLAANQIGIRYVLTPGAGWRQVLQQQVLPGAGRDAFSKNRAKVTTTDMAPGTFGQLAGFRFVTYSPDVAVIQLVSRFSTGTLQLTTSTVRWANGDWRLQLQPDGGTSPTAQRVDSLSGFVPWGGV